MTDHVDEDEPLKAEAAARKDWRGEEDGEAPQAPGHSLPASEDEDERMGSGEAPTGAPGAIPPPD